MLGMSIVFFVLTLLAALIAFGGVLPQLELLGQLAFIASLLLFAVFMRKEFKRQRASYRDRAGPLVGASE